MEAKELLQLLGAKYSLEHTGPPPPDRQILEAVMDIETTHLKSNFGFILCAVIYPVTVEGAPVPPVVLRIDGYPEYRQRMNDDRALVNDIVATLERCSRSYGWYSSGFDLKFLRGRRLAHATQDKQVLNWKFIQHYDMYKLRNKFVFHSNALATWMAEFTNRKKTELLPKQWQDAAYGDKAAMDYVVAHCLADAIGTAEVFKILRRTPFLNRLQTEPI